MTACRSFVVRLAAACALILGGAVSASAATIFVTTTADTIVGGDGCSLREALINANTNTRAGSIECVAGQDAGDIIVLPPEQIDIRSALTEEDDASVGDLDVTDDVVIWGGGTLFSRLSGEYVTRVLDIHPNPVDGSPTTLTLRGLSVQKGQADGQGGGLRANAGTTLRLEDVNVADSRISSFAVGGRGAGIYIAAGARADIARSAIMSNSTLGVDGMGAGIFCDNGCELAVRSTALLGNSATSWGGGLFVAPSGKAELSFVSMGYNRAVTGSALHAAGDVELFAVISSDNGNGLAGDDLNCAGGVVMAAYSFVEFPSACSAVTGITSRADLVGASYEGTALLPQGQQRFDGQPSNTLYWNTSFRSVFKGVVPATDPQCIGHRDQFARLPVTTAGCDIGAVFDFVLATNPMLMRSKVGGADIALVIGSTVTPAVPTVVRLEPVGGIGEVCDMPSQEVLVPAGSYSASFVVDPDTLFSRSAIGRPIRVCELQARAIDTTAEASVAGFDGVAGDPLLVGSTTGLVRIAVDTGVPVDTGLSYPASGTFLQMGKVPVGSGGTGNIVLRPSQAGWRVVAAVIDPVSPAPGRFALPAVLPLALDPVNGTSFPVNCLGGVLGEFEAFLNVTIETDTGSMLDLVYGLRCRVVHMLSMALSPRMVEEGERATLMLTLDSPSILPGPFSVDLSVADGDAVDGVDFTGLPGTLTFLPGEQVKEIAVATTEEDSVELDESVFFQLGAPSDVDVVVLGGAVAELRIANDDVATTGLELAPLSGVPARSPAGVRNPISTVLRNASHVDAAPLSNVSVVITVDKPVWVYSFVARKCASASCDASTPLDGWIYSTCTIEPSLRLATCNFPGQFTSGDQLEVSAVVEMAEINEAPTLDVHGMMRVTASASASGHTIEQFVESPYTITGIKSGGGGSLGLWSLLLVASGLALRGLRKRAGGGKVRRRVV